MATGRPDVAAAATAKDVPTVTVAGGAVVHEIACADGALGGVRAATASRRPAPTALGPNEPTARPDAACAAITWAGVRPGASWSWRAATAAACGAAAELPKKRNGGTGVPKN